VKSGVKTHCPERGRLAGEKKFLPIANTARPNQNSGDIILEYKCPWSRVRIILIVSFIHVCQVFFFETAFLTLLLFFIQKFKVLARLRILHRGDEETSEIWIAKEHSHNEDLETFFVLKSRVSKRMKDLCNKGVVASRIGVAICDELCDGDDTHPDLPTSTQVFLKIFKRL